MATSHVWTMRGDVARRIAITLKGKDAERASDFATECDARAECLKRRDVDGARCADCPLGPC